MIKEPEIADGFNDTEYRKLDTRVGRWLSVDPKADLYYSWSPYNLSADNPVMNSDLSGATVTPKPSTNGGGVAGAESNTLRHGAGSSGNGASNGAGVAGGSTNSNNSAVIEGDKNRTSQVITAAKATRKALSKINVAVEILSLDGTEFKTEKRYSDFPFAKSKGSLELKHWSEVFTPIWDSRWQDFEIEDIPDDFWVQEEDLRVYKDAKRLYKEGKKEGSDSDGRSWAVYNLYSKGYPLMCKSCIERDNRDVNLDPDTWYKVGIAQWRNSEEKTMQERYRYDETIKLAHTRYYIIGRFNNRKIARSLEKLLILQYKYSKNPNWPLKLQRDKGILTRYLLPVGNNRHS